MRVQLQFRGREMAHQEFGMQLMHKVGDDLAGMSQVEMEPKMAGAQHYNDFIPVAGEPAQTKIHSAENR